MSRTVALVLLTIAALGCGTSRLPLPAASSQEPADSGASAAPDGNAEPADPRVVRDAGDADAGSAREDAATPDAASPADAGPAGGSDAETDAAAPDESPWPVPPWPAATTQPPPKPTGALPLPQPSAAGAFEACTFEPASDAPLGASSICPSGVYRGDLRISKAEDAAAVAGCTRIEGNVEVNGDEDALANLAFVRVITGDLRVGAAAHACGFGKGGASICWTSWRISLAPLRSLRCVGGDVVIGNGEAASPLDGELSGLASLIEVGGVLNAASNSAHPLPPFRSLRRVWGAIEVTETAWLSTLETAYGRITMRVAGAHENSTVAKSAVPSLRYLGCGGDDPPCRDGVLGCGLTATTDAALERYSRCGFVMGDVKLDGPDVSTVSSLAALRTVKGSLWLTVTHVPDLNALSGVEHVSELRLDTNLFLNDVSGVDGITVQSIKVFDNAVLRDLTAWRSMRPVGDVDVLVDTNPMLETLGDWPWLVRAKSIRVGGDGLTSIGRFDNLMRIGEFVLTSSKLVTGGVFPGVQSVDRVTVRYAPALMSLPSFPSLNSRLMWLEVAETGVTDLRGLEFVVEADWANISDNPALTSLDGPSAWKSVGRFQLERNPVLRSLHGLTKLTAATELYINANASLTDCELEWLADQTNQPANRSFSENAGPGPCAQR